MTLERRAANPIVAAILRSPLHFLLSRRLLLLAYEGKRSGRYYDTPVLYREAGSQLVLFTPAEGTNWWKNFREGHPTSVLLRGGWHDGVGEVVTDEDAALEHLHWLLDPALRLSRLLLGHPLPSEKRLQRAATAVVLVRVTLEEGKGETEASGRSSA